MEFRILGPIEVVRRGELVGLRTGRTRSLLALLLVRAPHLVTVDGIIELLWIDPPSSAKAVVHNMISSLRRATAVEGTHLVVSRGGSYRIELGTHTLDLAEFRRATADGRRAMARGEGELAVSLLNEALGWWRGLALADAVEPLAGSVRDGLEAERLAATELRLDAELAIGRYQAALDTVGALLTDHAYREDLYARQMLALCGAGRRTEALAVYQQAYRRLVDDLGVAPALELRDLHQQVLDGTARLPHVASGRPGARAALPVPAQLPPTVKRLVGRDELLTDIRQALAGRWVAPSVVVLTGPGGIGKSALAVHAAHLLSTEFTGGQLYADLRGSHDTPASPHEIVGRFLRALGVLGDDVPADPDERVGRLRSELAGRRVLIVLDDARDEAQIRMLLPGTADCAVVITSRRRMDALPDAVTHVVPVLAPGAARQLLADASGSARPARSTEAAGAEVTRLCGYLPLAIRIAGARLAARPDWTLVQLHERLAGQRSRLDELAIGDLDVRATIALSYRSLPDEQRVMLRRLGLLDAMDVPAWVPVALSGTADTVLDRLVDCHLVEFVGIDQASQPRFRLHDLVHEFARERAIAEDHPTSRQNALIRVLDGWLALAGEAEQRLELDRTPSPPAREGAHGVAVPVARSRPYDWFEAERGNLLAAVHHAISLNEAELASDLTFRIGGFLLVRNYLSDRETIIRAAIACLERHRTPDHRVLRHLRELIATCGQRDDVDQMAALANRMMRLATELHDQAARVEAMHQLVSVAMKRGRLVEVVELSRWCVDESTRLGLPERQLAVSRHGLAVGLADLGDPAEAVAVFRQILAGSAFSGRARAIVLADYGEALVEHGRDDDAVAALTEAAEIVARIGDDVGAGRVRTFMADVAIAERDWPAAGAHLETALKTLTTHDDIKGRIFALRRLGDVAIGEGRADRATRLYKQALQLARQVGSSSETARALARLAIAADLRGDTEGTQRYLRECRRTLTELNLPDACLRLPRHLRQTITVRATTTAT